MLEAGSLHGLVIRHHITAQFRQDARQRLGAQTAIAFRQADIGNGLGALFINACFILQPAN